jgi:hypothetical protein
MFNLVRPTTVTKAKPYTSFLPVAFRYAYSQLVFKAVQFVASDCRLTLAKYMRQIGNCQQRRSQRTQDFLPLYDLLTANSNAYFSSHSLKYQQTSDNWEESFPLVHGQCFVPYRPLITNIVPMSYLISWFQMFTASYTREWSRWGYNSPSA